jgi:hypothetical protein
MLRCKHHLRGVYLTAWIRIRSLSASLLLPFWLWLPSLLLLLLLLLLLYIWEVVILHFGFFNHELQFERRARTQVHKFVAQVVFTALPLTSGLGWEEKQVRAMAERQCSLRTNQLILDPCAV